MTEFYETRMGVKFFEHTALRIVAELANLNANLERLAAATEHPSDPGRDTDESEPKAKEAQDHDD